MSTTIRSAARTRARLLLGVSAAAVVALSLAACSSGSTPSGGGTTSGGNGDGLDPAVAAAAASADPSKPETDTIKGALWQGPISAQWFLGAPTAESYGVTLQSDWMTDATVGRAELAAGSIDIVPGSPYGAAQLSLGGSDTLIVAGNYFSQPGEEALYALPGSGVKSVADLAGKTVAFTAVTGIDPNRVKLAIKAAGGDPDSMNIVASTFADMPGQLQNNTIQAADVAAYAIPAMQKIGAVPIFDFGSDQYEGRPFNVWMTSKSFYLAHPNAIAAFQCAMTAGGKDANDAAQIADFDKTTLKYSDAVVAAQINPHFATAPLTADQVQSDWDDEVAINGSPQFDVASLLVPYPQHC